VLYFTLVRSKLEYASVVWNSITPTIPRRLSPSSRSLLLSVSIVFSPHVPYSYAFALDKLNLYFLRKRRHHRDVHYFIVQVCRCNKSYTSGLENDDLHVPTCSVSALSMFSVYLTNRHCLSVRCKYHIFAIGGVSVNYIMTDLLKALLGGSPVGTF
jgi:hypothetical protein